MIDIIQMERYIYCRRRVEYLLEQSITDEEKLRDAFKVACADADKETQTVLANGAELTMRKIEANVKCFLRK